MRKKKKTIPARNDTSVKKKRVYKKKAALAKKTRTKAPKVRGAGTLSESEYFSKIRQSLRRSFRWWPPMMIALKKASRPSQSLNKRLKTEYICKKCENWFPRKSVEIDHIIECGSLNCYEDIVPFIQRLTEESPDSFQILCKGCHSAKTKLYLENKKKKI